MQHTQTLPASQVKNNFGAIVSQVHKGEYSEVIVENHGEPLVAIVDVKELKDMQAFRKQAKQKEALELLRKARAQVQARIHGRVSEQETAHMADRFSHEFVEDIAKEGKVPFERKSS